MARIELTTPSSRVEIDNFIEDWDRSNVYDLMIKAIEASGLKARDFNHVIGRHFMTEILDRIDRANIANPCNDNCTEIEHAKHEGAYEHQQKIDSVIEDIREELNINVT